MFQPPLFVMSPAPQIFPIKLLVWLRLLKYFYKHIWVPSVYSTIIGLWKSPLVSRNNEAPVINGYLVQAMTCCARSTIEAEDKLAKKAKKSKCCQVAVLCIVNASKIRITYSVLNSSVLFYQLNSLQVFGFVVLLFHFTFYWICLSFVLWKLTVPNFGHTVTPIVSGPCQIRNEYIFDLALFMLGKFSR